MLHQYETLKSSLDRELFVCFAIVVTMKALIFDSLRDELITEQE
jgi:hypothetical protein